MANGITFDTHEFVTGLVAKKMPQAQAEFLAKAYNDLLTDRIATKQDLREMEARIDAKIANLWSKVLVLQISSVGIILAALRFMV